MSSVMTVSQAKFLPTLGSDSEADGGDEQEEEENDQENEDHVDAGPLPFSDPESSSDAEGRPSAREKARARDASLVKLQQQKRRSSKDQSSRPDAVIVLKEERVSPAPLLGILVLNLAYRQAHFTTFSSIFIRSESFRFWP